MGEETEGGLRHREPSCILPVTLKLSKEDEKDTGEGPEYWLVYAALGGREEGGRIIHQEDIASVA